MLEDTKLIESRTLEVPSALGYHGDYLTPWET